MENYSKQTAKELLQYILLDSKALNNTLKWKPQYLFHTKWVISWYDNKGINK